MNNANSPSHGAFAGIGPLEPFRAITARRGNGVNRASKPAGLRRPSFGSGDALEPFEILLKKRAEALSLQRR